MPRTARAVAAGCYYHFINRGNNRARVFFEHADYANFLSLMQEACGRAGVNILAACLMPNHVHVVVRPDADDSLARWAHWLFTSHVRRHHKKYLSSGRIWQGRFKAFLIEESEYLIAVLRYVERNALRANLVDRAEDWRWTSLRWRAQSNSPIELQASPVPLPSDWISRVNQPQTDAELQSIRTSVHRQRPYGSEGWVARKVRELGLTHSMRAVGRPAGRRTR